MSRRRISPSPARPPDGRTTAPDARASPALARVSEFLTDFTSLWSWTGKLLVLAPLVDLLANLAPPWPGRMAVDLLSCLLGLVVLVFCFEFQTQADCSEPRLRSAMTIAGIACAVALTLFLVLSSAFIAKQVNGPDRIVIGFLYNENVKQRYGNQPYPNTHDLIGNWGTEFEVWEPWTIHANRVVILIVWFAFWGSACGLIGTFVSLQWRRRRAGPLASPTPS
jgi:hypothetical protein